jgi:hypothetical protein
MARRDLLEATGCFDEAMSHAEDLDLWIRLSRAADAAASGRPLVRYQHRPGGLTRQVVARLNGDIGLFRRLAADPTLPTALRRRAGRRQALAHYKLAMQALRSGNPGDARAHLKRSWVFPDRAPAVTLAWTMSLLPPALLARLRSQHWATRSIGPSLTRLDRVVLRSVESAPPPAEASRRAS